MHTTNSIEVRKSGLSWVKRSIALISCVIQKSEDKLAEPALVNVSLLDESAANLDGATQGRSPLVSCDLDDAY